MPQIPLYKQSYGYSCGPAGLCMVLGSLDKNLALNLDLEEALWEDANLGESNATSSYGLALGALKSGYKARVYANGEGVGFISSIMKYFPGISTNKIKLRYDNQKSEARKLGVEEIEKKVELKEIQEELDKECYPIILISSKMMGDFIGIPHWVVVTGVENGKVTLNNPETARTETYSIKRFLKYNGWGDQTRMVCVF